MLHHIKCQHKYRYRVWSSVEVATTTKGPYLYLRHKDRKGLLKIEVSRVVLWPRYASDLIAERRHTMSAVRSLCVYGCPLSPTTADYATVEEARCRGNPAAPPAVEPFRAGTAIAAVHAADNDEPVPLGLTDTLAPHLVLADAVEKCFLGIVKSTATAASEGAGDSEAGSGGPDEDVFRVDFDEDTGQPSPAALSYRNPLTPYPNPPRHAREATIGGAALSCESDHDGDAGCEEERSAVNRVKRRTRRWVLRCQTMDDLRALVRGLQGVSDYHPYDPDDTARAVPATAFVGSLEGMEAELVHRKLCKGR